MVIIFQSQQWARQNTVFFTIMPDMPILGPNKNLRQCTNVTPGYAGVRVRKYTLVRLETMFRLD